MFAGPKRDTGEDMARYMSAREPTERAWRSGELANEVDLGIAGEDWVDMDGLIGMALTTGQT